MYRTLCKCWWYNAHFLVENCRPLTLSWRKPLSYWNQSINLLRKSMDWFLHDNGLHHERFKKHNIMLEYEVTICENSMQYCRTNFKYRKNRTTKYEHSQQKFVIGYCILLKWAKWAPTCLQMLKYLRNCSSSYTVYQKYVYWTILWHWSLSIPLENIRKHLGK